MMHARSVLPSVIGGRRFAAGLLGVTGLALAAWGFRILLDPTWELGHVLGALAVAIGAFLLALGVVVAGLGGPMLSHALAWATTGAWTVAGLGWVARFLSNPLDVPRGPVDYAIGIPLSFVVGPIFAIFDGQMALALGLMALGAVLGLALSRWKPGGRAGPSAGAKRG